MRFDYGDAFTASRYTGYEVMIYSCSHGDATLFSRGDLVEAAWRVAQPLMDYWNSTPADFPNYARNSWGPKAAADLIERDGRRWHEIVTGEVLKKVALFKDGDPLFLEQVIMALRAKQVAAGELVIEKGRLAQNMYLLARGEVEVLDDAGKVLKVLKDGDIFGEIGILLSMPRTANVRAKTGLDLFVLNKADFNRILKDHPQFASAIRQIAKERYNVDVPNDAVTDA
jgi:glucose-6-phosphate 1-dehydrogenase